MNQDKHTIVEGGCSCGQVRFRVTGPPSSVGNCHCYMCQNAAGAPFVNWAEFSSSQVDWAGTEPQWQASSAKAERSVCPKCGAAVGFRFSGSDEVDLAVELFTDPAAFPPQFDIFTESAQPGIVLDDTIPHYKRGRRNGEVKNE